MAKQFTAIMASEAIIGPTINSQADGLESNTGRKGLYWRIRAREIKGRGVFLQIFSLSIFSLFFLSLFIHLNPSLTPLSLIIRTVLPLLIFFKNFLLIPAFLSLVFRETITLGRTHTHSLRHTHTCTLSQMEEATIK